jgi:hypothetical protein
MADAHKVTNWIWSLVAMLLLLVVAAHAVAPVAQQHGQGRGSAFSASTAEVSLKSGSRVLVAKEVVRLEPQAPVPALPALPALVVPPADRPALRALPGARDFASLLAETTLGPISPRAPPAA